ncbi:hypothetical protein [Enterococcus sp.]|uniref:hypothetical protein n=1 Tax=Enterococcus sp. TaxID=35783 RepID=UPI002FC7BCD2
MSETYYLVKRIIKDKYKEEYRISPRGKLLISAVIMSVVFGLLSFYKFYNIWRGIFLAISIFSLVFFYCMLYKESKVNRNKPKQLINDMKQSLMSKKINSIKLIDLLQEEIDQELENIEREKKVIFKRISVIFISIFWIPFAFLTKYVIEQSASEITWDNYVSIVGSLLIISTPFIGVVIAIGTQLEDFMFIAKKDLLLTRDYLKDIKYLYIMEEIES